MLGDFQQDGSTLYSNNDYTTSSDDIRNTLGNSIYFAVFAHSFSNATDMEGNIAVDCYSQQSTQPIGNSELSCANSDKMLKVHVHKRISQAIATSAYFQLYCDGRPLGDPIGVDFANGETDKTIDFPAIDAHAPSCCESGHTYSVYELRNKNKPSSWMKNGETNGDCTVSYDTNTFSTGSHSHLEEENYIGSFRNNGSNAQIQGHGFDTLYTGASSKNVVSNSFAQQVCNVWSGFEFIKYDLFYCYCLSYSMLGMSAGEDVQRYDINNIAALESTLGDDKLVIPYQGTAEQLESGTGPLLVINIDAGSRDKLDLNNAIYLTAKDAEGNVHTYPLCKGATEDNKWTKIAQSVLWNVWFDSAGSDGKLGELRLHDYAVGTFLVPSGKIVKDTGDLVGAAIACEVVQTSGEIHRMPLFQNPTDVTINCTNNILGLPTGLTLDIAPLCLLCGASVLGLTVRIRRRRAVRRG